MCYLLKLILLFLACHTIAKQAVAQKNSSLIKTHLLAHLKHCVSRIVRLENSTKASDSVDPYYHIYGLDNTFINELAPPSNKMRISYAGIDSKFHTTRQLHTKFMQCSVAIYFVDEILAFSDGLDAAHMIYMLQPLFVIRGDDPHAIVYVTSEDLFSLKYGQVVDYQTFDLLGFTPFTSTFYVISSKGCYMVCTKCLPDPGLFEIKTTGDIGGDQMWRRIHSSSNEIKIATATTRDWYKNGYTCELNTYYLLDLHDVYYAEECFLRLMAPKYNLTVGFETSYPTPTKFSLYPLRSRWFSYYVFPDSKGRIHNWNRNHQNIFLRQTLASYGIEVQQCLFGTTIKLEKPGFDVMLEPLDTGTWICLLISIIILLIFLRLVFVHKHMRNMLFFIYAILIEQSQDVGNDRKNFSPVLLTIVIVWVLFAIVISNGYKGILFTLLTMSKMPWVPKTGQEMVDSGIFMTTTTGVGSRSWDHKSLILEDILYIVKEVDEGRLQLQQDGIDILRRIGEKTLFIYSGKLQNLMKDMGEKHEKFDGSIISIPRKIIYIDYEKNVDLFSDLNRLFADQLVVKGENIQALRQVTYWHIDRSGVLRLLLPELKAIYESGIFQRWSYYEDILLKYNKMLYTAQTFFLRNDDLKLTFRFSSFLKYLLYRPFKIDMRAPPVSVFLREFSIFMLLLGPCFAISGIVWVVEVVTGHDWKKFLRMTRNKKSDA